MIFWQLSPPLCSCSFKYQLFCIDVKEKFHNFVKGKDWSLRSCSFPLMWRRSFYNFVKEKDWSLRSCGKHVLLSVRHVSCLYYGAENITLIIPDPKIFSFSLASSYLQPYPNLTFLTSSFLGKFPVAFGWRSFSLCSAQFPGKLDFFKTHTSDFMGSYRSSYEIFPRKQVKNIYSNFWQPVFRFPTSCSSYFASPPLPLTTPSPPPGPLAMYGADLVSYLFSII